MSELKFHPVGGRMSGTLLPFDSKGLQHVFSAGFTNCGGAIPSGTLISFEDNAQGNYNDTPFVFTNVATGPASVIATPLPGALPLFATALGALGVLGWRRKRKVTALPPA